MWTRRRLAAFALAVVLSLGIALVVLAPVLVLVVVLAAVLVVFAAVLVAVIVAALVWFDRPREAQGRHRRQSKRGERRRVQPRQC